MKRWLYLFGIDNHYHIRYRDYDEGLSIGSLEKKDLRDRVEVRYCKRGKG
jgi:hypothetical protein